MPDSKGSCNRQETITWTNIIFAADTNEPFPLNLPLPYSPSSRLYHILAPEVTHTTDKTQRHWSQDHADDGARLLRTVASKAKQRLQSDVSS